MRKKIMIVLCVLFISVVGACESNQDMETILRDEYPELVLLGFEKGQFTGSRHEEYLAFYQDPRLSPAEDSSMVIEKLVVFIIKNKKRVISRYDLKKLDIWSFEYEELLYLDIIKNPQLQFGRWAGYAYIGDYNGNGLEEILFFMLGGSCFLPTIIEFNGEEFEEILKFETDTSCRMLTEIRTETQNGQKLLKLYGEGYVNGPKGERDWYLYAWNEGARRYEMIEKGME
jgi:hypothetical protein